MMIVKKEHILFQLGFSKLEQNGSIEYKLMVWDGYYWYDIFDNRAYFHPFNDLYDVPRLTQIINHLNSINKELRQ